LVFEQKMIAAFAQNEAFGASYKDLSNY